jgi:hypothetical protein
MDVPEVLVDCSTDAQNLRHVIDTGRTSLRKHTPRGVHLSAANEGRHPENARDHADHKDSFAR